VRSDEVLAATDETRRALADMLVVWEIVSLQHPAERVLDGGGPGGRLDRSHPVQSGAGKYRWGAASYRGARARPDSPHIQSTCNRNGIAMPLRPTIAIGEARQTPAPDHRRQRSGVVHVDQAHRREVVAAGRRRNGRRLTRSPRFRCGKFTAEQLLRPRPTHCPVPIPTAGPKDPVREEDQTLVAPSRRKRAIPRWTRRRPGRDRITEDERSAVPVVRCGRRCRRIISQRQLPIRSRHRGELATTETGQTVDTAPRH